MSDNAEDQMAQVPRFCCLYPLIFVALAAVVGVILWVR